MFSLFTSLFTKSSSSAASKDSSKSRSTRHSKSSKSPSNSSSSSSSSSALSLLSGSSSCSAASLRTAPSRHLCLSVTPPKAKQPTFTRCPKELFVQPHNVLLGVIYPEERVVYKYDHPLGPYNPAKPLKGYFSDPCTKLAIAGWSQAWDDYFDVNVVTVTCSSGHEFGHKARVHSMFKKRCGKYRRDFTGRSLRQIKGEKDERREKEWLEELAQAERKLAESQARGRVNVQKWLSGLWMSRRS